MLGAAPPESWAGRACRPGPRSIFPGRQLPLSGQHRARPPAQSLASQTESRRWQLSQTLHLRLVAWNSLKQGSVHAPVTLRNTFLTRHVSPVLQPAVPSLSAAVQTGVLLPRHLHSQPGRFWSPSLVRAVGTANDTMKGKPFENASRETGAQTVSLVTAAWGVPCPHRAPLGHHLWLLLVWYALSGWEDVCPVPRQEAPHCLPLPPPA